MSLEGSGAVIQSVPDAPISLLNDLTVTNDSRVGFTWENGQNIGGTPIIDYSVHYDQSTGDFILLQSGVTTEFYMTTIALTKGSTYSFKV